MTIYKYRPGRFYLITLASTWVLWFAAAFASRRENGFAAAMIVALNRDMFFEKRHVGNIIPADKQP